MKSYDLFEKLNRNLEKLISLWNLINHTFYCIQTSVRVNAKFTRNSLNLEFGTDILCQCPVRRYTHLHPELQFWSLSWNSSANTANLNTGESVYGDHFVYAHSQWETTLHSNIVFHWLSTYTRWSLRLCSMLWNTPKSNHRITVTNWKWVPPPNCQPVENLANEELALSDDAIMVSIDTHTSQSTFIF